MWIFLLLPLLTEPQATAPPGAVELTVFRARAELPEAWRKLVPADFDWSRDMLATRARPPQAVELKPETRRTEVHRGDLYVWLKPELPEPVECPVCRGVRDPDEDLQRLNVKPARAPVAPLLRLARREGRVFEVHAEPVLVAPRQYCPPCTAP